MSKQKNDWYEKRSMTNWKVVGPDDEPYGDIEIHAGNGRFCRLPQDDAPVRDFNEMQWRRARLMKAAPNMLAALKAILASDIVMREEDEGRVSPELDMARDAVAEAEGVTL